MENESRSFLTLALVVVLFILIMASIAVLSGCTSNDGGRARFQGGNRSGFGNMSDAQRQQFEASAIAACQGKSQGDACTTQGAGGERPGTCRARNETLLCAGGMGRPGNASN